MSKAIEQAGKVIKRAPLRWVGVVGVSVAVLGFFFERGCVSKAFAAPIKAEAFVDKYDLHIKEYDKHAGYCSKVHDKIDKKLEKHGEAIQECQLKIVGVGGKVDGLTDKINYLITLRGGVVVESKAP